MTRNVKNNHKIGFFAVKLPYHDIFSEERTIFLENFYIQIQSESRKYVENAIFHKIRILYDFAPF